MCSALVLRDIVAAIVQSIERLRPTRCKPCGLIYLDVNAGLPQRARRSITTDTPSPRHVDAKYPQAAYRRVRPGS